jgi:predicted nucleic acid-binding protein
VPGGYLLDTNVVSETRKSRADGGVTAFLAGADATGLFLSVLTLGELRKGVAMKRRIDPAAADRLAVWVDDIETLFADRLLPVDTSVARRWGEMSATGACPVIDTLIAATALLHGLTLVTRNTLDVTATGVSLLDPWLGPS